MREKIRIPADVEVSTRFTNLDGDVGGPAVFTVESVPNGKYKKITKIMIDLPGLQDAIVIYPKERRPNAQVQYRGPGPGVVKQVTSSSPPAPETNAAVVANDNVEQQR